MAGEYTINFSDVMGHGSFGVVYPATNRAGLQVAVKVVSFRDHSRQNINEAEKLLKLPNEHPNIIDIYDVHEDKNNKYIFMEFCELGNLREFYRRRELTTREKVNLMIQIADGIAHLHAKGIIHRDIHPANILVQRKGDGSPQIKLSDFEVSKFIEGGMQSTMSSDVGTSLFKAPEFWKRDAQGRLQYKKSVDVFAEGLTFLAMLQADKNTRLAPGIEVTLDPNEMVEPIGYTIHVRMKNKLDVPDFIRDEGDDLTKKVKGLIRKMIRVLPEDRVTAEEVCNELRTF